jgi:hypothetical protein
MVGRPIAFVVVALVGAAATWALVRRTPPAAEADGLDASFDARTLAAVPSRAFGVEEPGVPRVGRSAFAEPAPADDARADEWAVDWDAAFPAGFLSPKQEPNDDVLVLGSVDALRLTPEMTIVEEPRLDDAPGGVVRLRLVAPDGRPLDGARGGFLVGPDERLIAWPRGEVVLRRDNVIGLGRRAVRARVEYLDRPWVVVVEAPSAEPPAGEDVDLGAAVCRPVKPAYVVRAFDAQGRPCVATRVVADRPGAAIGRAGPETFGVYASPGDVRSVRFMAYFAEHEPSAWAAASPESGELRVTAGPAFGRASGRVLFDGPASRAVKVRFLRTWRPDASEAGESDLYESRAAFENDASFSTGAVPSGTYRFRFALSGPTTTDEPLAVVDDVYVPPGGVADDPRLRAVDLRGLAAVADLVVEDERGGLIAGATAALLDAAGRPTYRTVRAAADGRLTWRFRIGDASTLRVSAPRARDGRAYREVDIPTAAAAARRVVLPYRLQVEIAAPNDADLAARGAFWRVVGLRRVATADGPSPPIGMPDVGAVIEPRGRAADGTAAFELDAAGDYAAVFEIVYPLKIPTDHPFWVEAVERPFESRPWPRATVVESDSVQRFAPDPGVDRRREAARLVAEGAGDG